MSQEVWQDCRYKNEIHNVTYTKMFITILLKKKNRNNSDVQQFMNVIKLVF